MALARVDYFDLRYDHRHRSPVIFLKDPESDKYLPVWIGELEASSIELAAFDKKAPRPLTHDLFSNVLRDAGLRINKVVIDRLESRTYYAKLFLEQDGQVLEFDCRPSDAVAIALREKAQIYVAEDLMYSIKFVELSDADALDEADDSESVQPESYGIETDNDSFQDFLKRISPTDFKDN